MRINKVLLFSVLLAFWFIPAKPAFLMLLHEKMRLQRMLDDYDRGLELFSNDSIAESIPYLCKYVDYIDRNYIIPDSLLFFSEEERGKYWEKMKFPYTEFIPKVAMETQADSLIEKAYNAALLSKGILLNSSLSLEKLFNNIQDDTLKSTYKKYMEVKKYLQDSINNYTNEGADSLEQVAYDLKRELIKNPYLQLFRVLLSIKWEQVYNCMKEKEVAIEFINYPIENDNQMYIALVLKYGTRKPQLIPLFKDSELPTTPSYPHINEELAYSLIWQKLQPCLKDMQTIYFSPTGKLHGIALEYLPDEEGVPVNWQYNMYRLSSTRELVSAKPSVSDTLVCSLWGDFNYSIDPIEKRIVSNMNKGMNNSSTQRVARDIRGAIVDDIVDLPMTRLEISSICNRAIQHGYKYKTYTGNRGTEEQFRRMSGKKVDVIHVATHGFYFPQNRDSIISGDDDMLMRSGIIMAGINNTRHDEPIKVDSYNDGILTALEVSQLDLSSADLVTLSACETGLGVVTSDGVYGLQRAFKKAGVQSVLVSLWNIDDEATSVFMKSYYRYFFESKNKFQSLRFAQLALTQYKDGKYNNRKYWSAFVLIDGINGSDNSSSDLLANEIGKINNKKLKDIQQINNDSIWLEAERAALESANDTSLIKLEEKETDWDLEEEPSEYYIKNARKRLEKIEKEMEEGIKDGSPTFGLG